MYEEIFYKRLVELRVEKGVSARDMSLSIGQSAGYINAIENRKGMPSFTVFFYICEFLEVTPSEFFDEGNPCPKEVRELMQDLKSLDKTQIENLAAIVKGLKN